MDRSVSFIDEQMFRTQEAAMAAVADAVQMPSCAPSLVEKGPRGPGHSKSLPNTAKYMINRSANIPISSNSSIIRRTASEHQLDLSQEEDEADLRDFLFYSRVVQGISRNHRHYQNGFLKYKSQMCLDNIVKTRHADLPKSAQDQYYADQYYQNPAEPESADETGIFDLDL